MEETRQKIKTAIDEQDALTDELSAAIDGAKTLTELDDLYRPYKKKSKTRATAAKEKGLEPLAEEIYRQAPDCKPPMMLAAEYINPEKRGSNSRRSAYGSYGYHCRKNSDDADIRKRRRFVCLAHGMLTVKAITGDIGVYEMYKDYSEPLSKIPDHRILAVNRGEKEGILKVSVDFDRDKAMFIISKNHIKEGFPATDTVKVAAEDAYTRLIFP